MAGVGKKAKDAKSLTPNNGFTMMSQLVEGIDDGAEKTLSDDLWPEIKWIRSNMVKAMR